MRATLYFQDCAFKTDYDQSIKAALTRGSIMTSLLTSGPIGDLLENIMADKEDEECGKPTDDEPGKHGNELSITDIPDNIDGDDTMGESGANEGATTPGNPIQDPEGKLTKWKLFASNMYQRFVKLIADPGDADALATMIKYSVICKCEVSANRAHVVVIYDAALAGEASARPHLRIVPFRDQHYTRSIRAALSAASGPELTSIADGWLYITFDGHVHGNEGKILKAFSNNDNKQLPKKKKAPLLGDDRIISW